MTDILFPENWPEIDVDDYIIQRRAAFDCLDLQTIPAYALLDKIQLTSLLLALLTSDPLKDKRERLNDVMFNEVLRQNNLVVVEYVRRVDCKLMTVDSQSKLFLEDFANLPEKPPAQTVGMKTLDLGATIAR